MNLTKLAANDPSIDPVLTFVLRYTRPVALIPKSRYDAFALLELIEKHTTRETLQ